MGDRAIVHFRSGDDVSPGVYLHWGGSRVKGLLEATETLMADRPDDMEYTCARFIGIAHSEMPNQSTGLGVWNAASLEAIRDPDYSHGDAGVFIVDVSARPWAVEMHGGYGFGGD